MALSSPVCVVGGSGWVGGSLVYELVSKGYAVRAVVRDPDNPGSHLTALLRQTEKNMSSASGASQGAEKADAGKSGSLDIIDIAELEHAAKDCHGLIHAVEYADIEKDDPIEQMVAQVADSLDAAAKEPLISRVVVLSSMAAVCGSQRDHNPGQLYTPEHIWTERDFNDNPQSTFAKAAVAAEKAAWDLVKGGHKGKYSLTTIHPSMVWGPLVKGQKLKGPQMMLFKLINGEKKALQADDMHLDVFGIVHVRDVVRALIAGLEAAKAANQRYLCTSREQYSLNDIVAWIREDFPELASRKFDESIHDAPDLKKIPHGRPSADLTKIYALLGVDELTPPREAVRDAIDSFRSRQLMILGTPAPL